VVVEVLVAMARRRIVGNQVLVALVLAHRPGAPEYGRCPTRPRTSSS
jgi:hypothetical protein